MVFKGLASVISRCAKWIILAWVLLLLVSVPFAAKVGDALKYDTDSMAVPDAESISGLRILNKNFYAAESAGDSVFLLVAEYGSPEGRESAERLGAALNDGKSGFTDGSGSQKIAKVTQAGSFGGADSGVVLYQISYTSEHAKGMSEDTVALRGFVKEAAASLPGMSLYVTGTPAMNHDTEVESAKDLSRIDPFTILLILVLVGLFFRSFVTSAMPPMVIGAAFGAAMMAMFLIASIMNVSYVSEMFLLVSMMGAGCDYCIFILARYHEERRSGKDHGESLRESVTWAGESIATSGTAVMIGFGAMSICSFPMISSMGVVLAAGILIAMFAALTLITSILAIAGDRLFWPSGAVSGRKPGRFYARMSKSADSYFRRSVRFSMRRAKPIFVVAVLFTVPMAYITFTAPSSYDMVSMMSSGEAADGMKKIEEHTDGGMLTPNYMVMELSAPIGEIGEMDIAGSSVGYVQWTDPVGLRKIDSFQRSLTGDDNIGSVYGVYVWKAIAEEIAKSSPNPGLSDHDYAVMVFGEVLKALPERAAGAALASGMPEGAVEYLEMSTGAQIRYDSAEVGAVMDWIVNYAALRSIGADGSGAIKYVSVTAVTRDSAMSNRSMDTIGYCKAEMESFAAGEGSGLIAATWMTGSPAVMFEISGQVSGEFGKVELLAVLLIMALLFFVMRSYVTPLRSVLTILMSVAWTIGVTHLIFSDLLGHGVLWMIPIILMVVCLGLGMDYDILLTTRIKENVRHRGMSNDDAIASAVTSSGSVITICGIIMGGAFGTLMLSNTMMLKEFGFALCFAILVDALIVRTYIVPAVMHLLGDWNWKGPRFMHRDGR
ncbi:MAG: MMPL family transporter [Candidatus Methanoplasma sp.]|jgi:RND superfamily putative drug exporter|nr:MMPL family transporter [Candidatus Methanoplasma sp.]